MFSKEKCKLCFKKKKLTLNGSVNVVIRKFLVVGPCINGKCVEETGTKCLNNQCVLDSVGQKTIYIPSKSFLKLLNTV